MWVVLTGGTEVFGPFKTRTAAEEWISASGVNGAPRKVKSKNSILGIRK